MVVLIHKNLCSEMIVLLPEPFCHKMIVMFLCDSWNDMFIAKNTFDTGLDIRGSSSNIFENERHHQEDFRQRNLRGCSSVSWCFLFWASYLQLLGQWWAAQISPKLEARTIILGRGEYSLTWMILQSNGHGPLLVHDKSCMPLSLTWAHVFWVVCS